MIERWKERTREKLRADFSAFAQRAWKIIEPSKELQWNWHHQLICEHLQMAFLGEETRLIITQPPRTLKSRLTSVLFPAWCWAQSPGQSFILVSYSDSLSEELNILRRVLLQSPWFQSTFPGNVQFSNDQNRREQFANLQGGQMIATSVTGTLTGKGSDFIIVDDVISPQQSYSDLERVNANRFFDSTLRSRLNEPTTGRIICISQRLHESDLPGHLLENERGAWLHINIPMECEQDEKIEFPVSGTVMTRRAGDLLQPGRFPKSWCDKTRATVGPYIWSGQYQQRPAPAGGAIFKREWFRSFTELPEKGQTIISIDSAFSIKRTADYSVASVWRAFEGKYYLAWVWRERCEYPRLKAMAEELYQTWNPDALLIEEKGSGQSLIQSLREETALPVVAIPAIGDKISRAHAITALLESGRTFFPKEASWLAPFLHELELFPSGAHDDQVDSLTQALAYLRSQQWGGRLTWLDTVKAHAADWARGVFGSRKKTAGKLPGVAEAQPGSVSVNNFEMLQKTWKRACPSCGSTCNSVNGGPGESWCNQCGRRFNEQGEIVFEQKTLVAGVNCCGRPLPQKISNGLKCGNCGMQDNDFQPAGATFDHLRRRRNRFSL